MVRISIDRLRVRMAGSDPGSARSLSSDLGRALLREFGERLDAVASTGRRDVHVGDVRVGKCVRSRSDEIAREVVAAVLAAHPAPRRR